MVVFELLVGDEFDSLWDLIQLISEFDVPFVFLTFFASILTELIALSFWAHHISSKSGHFQVGGVGYWFLNHYIDILAFSWLTSRAGSSSAGFTFLPFSSDFLWFETVQEFVHELFDGRKVDVRHLEELFRHGNDEESLFREFLDLISSVHKLVELIGGEFGSGLVGKYVMEKIADFMWWGHCKRAVCLWAQI